MLRLTLALLILSTPAFAADTSANPSLWQQFTSLFSAAEPNIPNDQPTEILALQDRIPQMPDGSVTPNDLPMVAGDINATTTPAAAPSTNAFADPFTPTDELNEIAPAAGDTVNSDSSRGFEDPAPAAVTAPIAQ